MVIEKNYIKKISIDISLRDVNKAMRLKGSSSNLAHAFLIPAISEVLDQFSSEIDQNQFIQIERLDLDINSSDGNLESSSFLLQFKSSLYQLIKDQLLNLKNQTGFESQDQFLKMLSETSISTKESGFSEADHSNFLKSDQLDSDRRLLHTFVYFLKFGNLPWWISSTKALSSAFEETNLLKMLRENRESALHFLPALLTEQNVSTRLVFQFSARFIQELLFLLSDVWSEVQAFDLPYFDRLFTEVLDREKRQVFLLELIRIQTSKSQVVEVDLKELSRSVEQVLGIQMKVGRLHKVEKMNSLDMLLVLAIHLESSGLKRIPSILERIEQFLDQTEQKGASPSISDLPTANTALDELVSDDQWSLHTAENVNNEVGALEKQAKDEEFTAETEEKRAREEPKTMPRPLRNSNQELVGDENFDLLKQAGQKGMAVENAGLILLNPFFKHLFNNCGLLDEEQKITDPTLAVHTLHYVATSQECAADYALLFEKYLIGLPMGMPIDRERPLSEHIKKEVGLMFEALKQNWTIMSGSSNALIQNEYLKRNGKLFIDSDTHRLVVKREAIDLLIDKIPWTISMVRFPWKKEMLYTDW